jgi:hypothetical protein
VREVLPAQRRIEVDLDFLGLAGRSEAPEQPGREGQPPASGTGTGA